MNIHEHQAKQILKKYGNRVKFILKPTKKEAMDTILSGEADIYIENYQIHKNGYGFLRGSKLIIKLWRNIP